jgi:hypothetical protein
MPSTSIDTTPKKLQEAIQQDFLIVHTNRRGANRFKGGYFQKITRNTSGKPNIKHPSTLDLIQVSSDLKIPHKILREVSAEELEPHREEKYESIPPHKPFVNPTSYMPTQYPNIDRLSTSFKGSKPSSEISDHTPAIEKLQQENVQLLQQVEERNTMDRHLQHDNVVLQEKVNSLKRLVDKTTNDNLNLRAQLKHCKRAKTKSSGQESSKANPSPSQQV